MSTSLFLLIAFLGTSPTSATATGYAVIDQFTSAAACDAALVTLKTTPVTTRIGPVSDASAARSTLVPTASPGLACVAATVRR